jgi:alpha-1,2-mannosyltransferase
MRRGAWVALAAMAVTLAVFLAQALHKATRPGGYDLTGYLAATHAMMAGQDPYAAPTLYSYIYPLFLCVVLAPLSVLPSPALDVAWFALGVAALGASAWMVLRRAAPRLSPADTVVPLAATFVVLAGVVQNNLLNGQVNPLVLLACVLFLAEYLRGRRVSAALLLGAAIALKLTPVVLVVYLLARREWLTVMLAGLATLVFAAALPWMVAGPAVAGWYAHYADAFLAARLASGTGAASVAGFSLTSMLRLAMPGLAMPVTLALATGLALAAPVGLQVMSWRHPDARREMSVFALYLVAVPLVSPMSEPHHLAMLLPAVAVLIAAMATQGARLVRACGAALVIAALGLALGRAWPAAGFAAMLAVSAGVVWVEREVTASHAG